MLERFEVDFYHPHRVMTRDEYDTMKISGLHSVCHDWDGFGGTAVWMHSNVKLAPALCLAGDFYICTVRVSVSPLE